MTAHADVIVIGAGLAGLVATAELVEAGKRVILLEQEPESNFGGQAWWSFGGLFLVDSPEQRRMGIKEALGYFLEPTPGGPNVTESRPGFAAPPKHPQARGFPATARPTRRPQPWTWGSGAALVPTRDGSWPPCGRRCRTTPPCARTARGPASPRSAVRPATPVRPRRRGGGAAQPGASAPYN